MPVGVCVGAGVGKCGEVSGGKCTMGRGEMAMGGARGPALRLDCFSLSVPTICSWAIVSVRALILAALVVGCCCPDKQSDRPFNALTDTRHCANHYQHRA